MGSPDGDPRLDGRSDVVRVDMAVPHSVTTHHHDRVAERIPGRTEVRNPVVGGVEEVHDLVAGTGQGCPAVIVGPRGREFRWRLGRLG